MKPGAYLACVAALLVGATWTVRAETHVGGVICTDTTWGLAGSPYIVTREAGSSVVVCCGVTLTIEPGVQVRFEPGLALRVAGTLVARGTEQSPILFTSNQPTPAPGDWNRIEFLDQAADATFDGSGNYLSGCILEHVIVEYAGADSYDAVNVDRSAPYFSYCEVRENSMAGIGVWGAPGRRIENCYVHHNHNSGIYIHRNSGGNMLIGNTISANSNDAGHGGGVYITWGSGSTLTGNTISQNTCFYGGGGIFAEGAGGTTLTSNIISGNSGKQAGGILVSFCNGTTLVGNTISGNTATAWEGGGFEAVRSYDTTLVGNTIKNNTAAFWGGGLVCGLGSLTVVNCTFSGNSATLYGGGIFLADSSSVTAENCILWGNAAPDGPEIAIGWIYDPSTFTVSYSDVEGGQAGVYVEPGCTLNWGPGNIDADPLFVDPGSGNLRLNAGSPCIDAGDNTAVPRDTTDLDADGCRTDRMSLDLDGNYRFHDDPNTPDTGVGTYWYPGVVDMGAYEYGSDHNVPDGPCFGDLNCDGGVNFGDINPFVLALSGQANYEAAYPNCHWLNADCNDDGEVNFADINPFVALLSEP